MNSKLWKNLKSIKGWVNGALIFVGLPLLPFLVAAGVVLFLSNFDFLNVFYDFWSPSTLVAVPFLLTCFCGVPLIALSRHAKDCLGKEKGTSAKKVSLLRIFFTIALVITCGLSLYFLILYSSVGINTFSLFIAFFLLSTLIGSMFAFKAFNKARQACKK